MLVRWSVDQLRGDPHLVADPQHRAFDYRIHVQHLSDLRQLLTMLAFELHNRRA